MRVNAFMFLCEKYFLVRNDSFPRYFSDICHDSFIRVIWLIHLYMCQPVYTWKTIRSHGTSHINVMTLSYVWYDWFIYMCDDPFIRVKRFVPVVLLKCLSCLFYMCDMSHSLICVMTHLHVWNDLFPCNMTHSCICHDSLMCVIWLIHVCDVTHVNRVPFQLDHAQVLCVTCLFLMCEETHSAVAWHIHMCDMTL